MSKFKAWLKENYLFAALIVFVIVLLTIIVVVRIVNKEKLTYEPLNGEISYDIKVREANKYNIIKIDDQDIATLYFRDWVYLITNKPEEAYKLLDKKSKAEFDTYEKFQKWIKQYVTAKTKDSTLIGYKYKKEGAHNEIIMASSEHMRYRFNEYSVWNYKVEILGQERNEPSTTKVVLQTKTTKK